MAAHTIDADLCVQMQVAGMLNNQEIATTKFCLLVVNSAAGNQTNKTKVEAWCICMRSVATAMHDMLVVS